MKAENYTVILRLLQSPRRYRHSLGVQKEAVRLAKRYGGDAERAATAGLLHDIAKDLPGEQQRAIIRRAGIGLTDLEARAPKLWHAIAGSVLLRDAFGLPEDIVSAVRYHTTGKAGMTPGEQILYLADFTSEDRDFPGVETIRRAADISAEAGMAAALRYSVLELCAKNAPIHPDTFRAYNEVFLRQNTAKEGSV